MKDVTKSKDFEDEAYGLEIYPTRENKFHVSLSNIRIGSDEESKEYTLELKSDVLSSNLIMRLADRLGNLGVNSKNITKYDILYAMKEKEEESRYSGGDTAPPLMESPDNEEPTREKLRNFF